MRNLSSAAIEAYASGRYGRRTLLKMSPSGDDPLCIWDDVGSISYGGDTYVGAAGRFTVEPVISAADLTIRGLRCVFNALDEDVLAMVTATAWHQQPIIMYRATIAIDAPQTLNVHQVFSGFMDKMTWGEGVGDTATILLQCESASRELSLNGSRTASDADQRERDADDGFFAFATNAVSTNIDWGYQPSPAAPAQAKPKGLAKLLGKIF